MHSFKLTSLTLSKEITEGKLSLEYASDELSEKPLVTHYALSLGTKP